MKKLFLLFTCMTVLAVLFNVPSASAQGKLEGVWKYAEIIPPAGFNAKPMPIHEGLLVFTKHHFSMIFVAGAQPRPELPQQGATDAQKVAAWTPLYLGAGTYEIKGDRYIAKSLVSKDPGQINPDAWMAIEFKIEGDTLITTPKETNAGPLNYASTKLIRVE
jgi:hypothetical protein